jgi:hypothetical protein
LLKNLNQLPLLRAMLLQEMPQLLLRAELLLQVMLNLLMEKLNQEKQQKLLRLRKNLQLLLHLQIKRNNI